MVVLAFLAGGCLHPDLIDCTDDLQCPQGTTCLADQNVCVDPRGVELPDGTIDFTTIACGRSAELSVPLSNHGITPVVFSARSTIDAFSVTPDKGSVAPGETIDLLVTATPTSSALPGQTIEGALEVETFTGIAERRLMFTPAGGIAHVPEALDFGELPLNTPPSQLPLVIENAGTAPFGVSFDLHSGVFSLVGALTSASVAPQSSLMVMVDYDPPTLATSTTTLALDYDRALCEPPPSTVKITGRSSGDPMLSSLQTVDFGDAACGASAKVATFSITSNMAQDQQLTVSVVQETEWFKGPASTISLPVGGTTTIPITRLATLEVVKPEELKSHSAMLHITAMPANVTKDIPLSWTLSAPFLKLSTDKLDLVDKNQSLEVTNLGSDVAPVTVTPSLQSMNGVTVQFIDQIAPAPGESDRLNAQLLAGQSTGSMTAVFYVGASGNCSGPQKLTVGATVNKPAPPPEVN